MYARVARWEGQDPGAVREMVEDLRKQSASGPPQGVPAVGATILVDPDQGTSMAIMLFETEDDLRKGHEVMDAMTPPRDTGGRRVSVEMFEVGMDVRLADRAPA